MKVLIAACVLAIVSACKQAPPRQENRFTDIKGYFDKEIKRLEKSRPMVIKTVSRNAQKETKSTTQISWADELNLFAESDINKPAWKDSYQKTTRNGKETYVALDADLKTRRIQVVKDSTGRIEKIQIENRTSNQLYQSVEHLTYIPDSLYRIDKKQHVVLISDSHYLVTGIITQ